MEIINFERPKLHWPYFKCSK